MKYKFFIALIAPFFLAHMAHAQLLPPYLQNVNKVEMLWVDSVLAQMTPEEKIAQLFMISAYSNKDEAHFAEIENFIKKYKLGGLIFMQGTPEKQAELINRYQHVSKVPLLIGFDGEWGLNMRLKNTIDYPRQMVLGAIQNNLLIYEMGREFARQMKLVGIHFNFAPVVDVNVNPKNPVINDRSFGEEVPNVIQKGIMYMKGLQDGGILACAKHFPGHGDTEVDSHLDLPVIKQSRKRLEQVEFKPFRALIDNGVGAVMVAHLNVPALDSTPNLPSTLSAKIVDSILLKSMNFKGLVFTDALNMKGISKYYPSGEAEVRALLAGNDIMLFSENVPKAIKGVLDAVASGRISQDLIEEKVRKVLLAKYWLGLNHRPTLDTSNLNQKINTDYAQFLKEKLLTAAVTVVSDKYKLIPVGDLSKLRIASVQISGDSSYAFTQYLDNYDAISHFYISKNASPADFQKLIAKLSDYNLIINAHFDLSRFASKKHGLTDASIQYLKTINQKKKCINVFFGIPYVLNLLAPMNTIVIANTPDSESQSAAVQVIFGGMSATGKLPVRAGIYAAGSGLNIRGGTRLRYVNPLYFDIKPSSFDAVDKLAQESIQKATPGCQILVAYQGAVIYQKSFGNHTYQKVEPVKNTDLYDLASLTKITATAPVLMTMYEQGNFKLDKNLGHYLPDLKGNKRGLKIEEILTHQSGLPAWIPFYKKTLNALNLPDTNLYKKVVQQDYSVPVADSMFMKNAYIDTIYQKIAEAPLEPKVYRYSDLGYYYFKKIIEEKFKKGLDEVADSLIWKKLGGNNTMYNPLTHGVQIKRINPTEQDHYFRMQTIRGYVHDQGAAMLGGVGGHAGLFSNANDLAKYFQMLLNDGKYGGVRFFEKSTIKKFTSRVYPHNRRGLAFDKPVISGEGGPACNCASPESFGHTGFTGTIAWADPKHEILFIFLSNRTYPDSENRLLINQNIRTRMQKIIYDVIDKN